MWAVRIRSLAWVVVAVALVATACSSGGQPAATTTPPPSQQLNLEVASTDLYVGAPQRVGVGMFFADERTLSFGTTDLAFAFIGTAQAPVKPKPGPEATASYVPTPETPAGTGQSPAVTSPSQARGIYVAENVMFDRAGFWTVTVTAQVEGRGTLTAMTTFPVTQKPALPAPGQPALPTQNLTMHSKGVPRAAIDSRYTNDGTIPDPELHETTIAQALKRHEPALVVFSTPVYCISRFCGPVTDLVDALSKRYGDRAVFIHIEIYRDFQQQVINQAAADWLYRNGELTEPWLYLIGADGTIVDRWSSLWSREEVAAELEPLPPMT
jgi:hypothetical protein